MDDPAKMSASPSGPDGDGVRITRRDARGFRSALPWQLLALALILGFAGYVVTMGYRLARPAPGASGSDSATAGDSIATAVNTDESVTATPATGAESTSALTARPAPVARDPNDLATHVAPGQAPQMKEVIQRLHDAGIHTGLGAFSPPGTSPPLIGLAVPDDYVLPAGYVRHFQATDDGQRIEPILMYSPDFEFFDSAGRRIAIPPDRVVPPSMAPPGLPIRAIEIPPPIDPGSSPR